MSCIKLTENKDGWSWIGHGDGVFHIGAADVGDSMDLGSGHDIADTLPLLARLLRDRFRFLRCRDRILAFSKSRGIATSAAQDIGPELVAAAGRQIGSGSYGTDPVFVVPMPDGVVMTGEEGTDVVRFDDGDKLLEELMVDRFEGEGCSAAASYASEAGCELIGHFRGYGGF